MPKLYEYFGLVVLFYSNEHEPVHVHGLYQGRECRADFRIVDGRVVEVKFQSVKGRRPLERTQLNDFKLLVDHYADDIVRKWVDYFVMHKSIEPERIDRRLR
jgi:hypothetical protein